MAKNKVKAIVRSDINSASMTSSYQALNFGGLDEACFFIRLVNNSNQGVSISYDGVVDHDYIPSNGVLDIDGQTNASPNGYVAQFGKGQVVYVKGTAGTGFVYLSGYYTLPN